MRLGVADDVQLGHGTKVVLDLAIEAGGIAARLEWRGRGIAALGLPGLDPRGRLLGGEVPRRRPGVDVEAHIGSADQRRPLSSDRSTSLTRIEPMIAKTSAPRKPLTGSLLMPRAIQPPISAPRIP